MRRNGCNIVGESSGNNEIIHMYCDGACSGNPGPAGIGVYMEYKGQSKKHKEYIGHATNNIAELKAVQRGLSAITNKDLTVRVYTDSQYAIGMLTQHWKAKKNQQLINDIKKMMKDFSLIRFIKVAGHSGNIGNEICNELAVQAIKGGKSG